MENNKNTPEQSEGSSYTTTRATKPHEETTPEGVSKPSWFLQAVKILDSKDSWELMLLAEALPEETPGRPGMSELKWEVRNTMANRLRLRMELAYVELTEMPAGEEYNQLKKACEEVIASQHSFERLVEISEYWRDEQSRLKSGAVGPHEL